MIPDLNQPVVLLSDLSDGDYLVQLDLPDGRLGLLRLAPADVASYPGHVFRAKIESDAGEAKISRHLRPGEALS